MQDVNGILLRFVSLISSLTRIHKGINNFHYNCSKQYSTGVSVQIEMDMFATVACIFLCDNGHNNDVK